jgi:hypothetical protein
MVISAIIVGTILAARFFAPQSPAAVTPSTAPLVRLTEADSLMQKTAVELQRCRGDYNDFDTHSDNSEQLLAQLRSLGWCLKGADHLSLHWRDAKLRLNTLKILMAAFPAPDDQPSLGGAAKHQ